MRILLSGILDQAAFAGAWAAALSELGHEIAPFDTRCWYSSGFFGKLEHRYLLGPGPSRLNRALVKAVKAARPDAVILHNPNGIAPEAVREIATMSVTVGYHHDDPFGAFAGRAPFVRFRETLPWYHSTYVVRSKNLADFMHSGARLVKLLPRYYVPWLHHPEPSSERHGVVFVGHLEKDRRCEYISACLRADLPVRLFGSPEWPAALAPDVRKKVSPVTAAFGPKYRQVLCNSKISLAFHSTANNDDDSYRVYEICACGGFLLAYRTDLMSSLYIEGVEAEFFSTPEELVSKSKFYLERESLRTRIASAGHARCVREGRNVVTRMRQVVRDVTDVIKDKTI